MYSNLTEYPLLYVNDFKRYENNLNHLGILSAVYPSYTIL